MWGQAEGLMLLFWSALFVSGGRGGHDKMEMWEGREVARWEKWDSSEVARWEVPDFIQEWGVQV